MKTAASIRQNSKSRWRKVVGVMMWVLLAILAILAVLLLILLWFSPGKVRPFLDDGGNVLPGSVSEIAFVEIGGMEQGMIIQGKSEANPVLLFLHGGPGSPEYFMNSGSGLGLEEDFTVCWWEQRGSGLSYRSDIPPETMTLEQFIQDTVEVTDYLRERFGQEKVYVMGHSWGTFLGMHVIQRYPELYHAYIGVGQISNQLESERLAYHYMVEEARNQGLTKMEKSLLKYDVDTIDKGYLMSIRSSAMNRLGVGVMHEMSTFQDMVLPLLTCRAYTLPQKVAFGRGSLFSLEYMFDLTTTVDLMVEIPRVEVPVYILHGRYDMQVSHDLAKEYFEALDAPVKGFHTFEDSAHSPLFEEPEAFMQILRGEVLVEQSR